MLVSLERVLLPYREVIYDILDREDVANEYSTTPFIGYRDSRYYNILSSNGVRPPHYKEVIPMVTGPFDFLPQKATKSEGGYYEPDENFEDIDDKALFNFIKNKIKLIARNKDIIGNVRSFQSSSVDVVKLGDGQVANVFQTVNDNVFDDAMEHDTIEEAKALIAFSLDELYEFSKAYGYSFISLLITLEKRRVSQIDRSYGTDKVFWSNTSIETYTYKNLVGSDVFGTGGVMDVNPLTGVVEGWSEGLPTSATKNTRKDFVHIARNIMSSSPIDKSAFEIVGHRPTANRILDSLNTILFLNSTVIQAHLFADKAEEYTRDTILGLQRRIPKEVAAKISRNYKALKDGMNPMPFYEIAKRLYPVIEKKELESMLEDIGFDLKRDSWKSQMEDTKALVKALFDTVAERDIDLNEYTFKGGFIYNPRGEIVKFIIGLVTRENARTLKYDRYVYPHTSGILVGFEPTNVRYCKIPISYILVESKESNSGYKIRKLEDLGGMRHVSM